MLKRLSISIYCRRNSIRRGSVKAGFNCTTKVWHNFAHLRAQIDGIFFQLLKSDRNQVLGKKTHYGFTLQKFLRDNEYMGFWGEGEREVVMRVERRRRERQEGRQAVKNLLTNA